ncbi:MiaB/RimO family radical SAM methylthiotransferase [candidate division WOR-3 bacterium]|nr:MiaB/RimO family radical SAM methylthiotransferase [candidate division WOR-3 bacterium]
MTRSRVLVASCGCKLNQAEADLWKAYLARNGYEIAVGDANHVDLCVVTTCTVTSSADRSTVALIRRLHRRFPNAEIKVTGCGPEVIRDRLARLEGVRELTGYESKESVISALSYGNQVDASMVNRSRAFLRVGDGCDRRCAYCIVSRIRGQPNSKPQGQVIDELHALSEAGFGEVVLVALNLGIWGMERGESLAELLKEIDKHGTRTPRIRLTSLEPDTVTHELMDVIAFSPRICPHLHLPLQSGDDKILEQMGRPYRTAEYAGLIEGVVQKIPDVCIGTDVITSTPGEDSGSFARTLAFVKTLPIAYVHAFTYSPRPGTPMAKEKNSVRNPRQRTKALRKIGKVKSLDYRNRFIGKTRQAVVLSPTRALTDNYLDVTVSETNAVQRSLVSVRITGTTQDAIFGEALKSEDDTNET